MHIHDKKKVCVMNSAIYINYTPKKVFDCLNESQSLFCLRTWREKKNQILSVHVYLNNKILFLLIHAASEGSDIAFNKD